MSNATAYLKCPYCGWLFTRLARGLVPWHNEQPREGEPRVAVRCHGIGQAARNAESDRRVLWRELSDAERARIVGGSVQEPKQ